MALNLIQRPEKREFHYKPRYYQSEENKTVNKDGSDFDPDKFAERLHKNWSSHRMRKDDRNKFPLKMVIWLAFIIFVLVYFFVKFFEK